ncbi:hypothetical protein CHCC16736_4208 [Bacillus licheniformis]|uniref:Uncharacterized protein n=1 Tax=Bacillus licheniformis TaxID=1402 RepID=A0A8B5Y9T8_BACLI|nr:hypothetical protein B34_00430 [Bacillus licheniformis]TWL25325.1 hypothetical protein CHCC16736_4208 [Bacillus licheniformis]TWL68773.1 hypothetical protein CHCC15318_1515 [Bacillus licheniformis]TWM59991.1 hypothetical protein CHCC14813_4167 [Bacillus licheniformis]TWM60348.1 hypothetical protein CHCC14810_1005 [Bacillus licheniformis]
MDWYTLIIVINCLSAFSTIAFTFFKSKLTFVPMLNIGLSIITAATTEYNVWTISLIILSLILLFIFYSVKKYSEVEYHCSQASALFGGTPTTKELIKTVTENRKPQAIKPLLFAKGIETVARKGEQYSVASDLLFAAGNLHLGLSHDYLKCITLLINVKRFFGLSESYESISDKLAVTAMKGVQLEQFEEAYKAYKENVIINQNNLVDFLSALITLIKTGDRPQKAGESLATIMNSLLEKTIDRENL